MSISTEHSQLLQEMERFCAYQERSPFEIRKKLLRKGAPEEAILFCLKSLNEKNFLNEVRFVQSYIEGKSSIKKWGLHKIYAGLKAHRIPESLIQEQLQSFDQKGNQERLLLWFQKKEKSLSSESDSKKKKQKIVRYLLSKGFSFEEIMNLF
jgi:regulatory protein